MTLFSRLLCLASLFLIPHTVMAMNPLSFSDFDQRGQRGEPLSVVFFGGSLTWGANASDPNLTSYRGLMGKYLRDKYPKSPIAIHDAAIGGTGSALGQFRVERDVLAYKPDIVFLGFTVNDNIYGGDREPLIPYETILRELISKNILVVQVLMTDKSDGTKPVDAPHLPRYDQHLKFADAYGLPKGDVYMHVRQVMAEHKIDPKTFWPFDGIHPDDIGYQVFFEAVRDAYEAAIKNKQENKLPPEPLEAVFARRERIHLVDRPLPKGWTRTKTYRTSMWYDGLSSRWMDDVAMCDVKTHEGTEPLKVEFDGTFVGLFGEADEDGLGFKVSIDGQPLQFHAKPKDPGEDVWPMDTSRFGKGRLFMWRQFANNLTPGKHTLEITPVFAEGKAKGQLRIESICAAGGADAK